MQKIDYIRARDEATKAIRDGLFLNASNEQLASWLMGICDGNIRNEDVRHAEIVRGITINHIQMARVIRSVESTMERLNKSNEETQKKLTILTWATVILGTIQLLHQIFQ